MRRSGFTLIEMLLATALLTVALGMIWHAWFSAQDTTEVLHRKMTATESTVHAMALLRRDLRSASRASLSPVPAASLSYRVVSDGNGDGLPIDASGAPELSEIHIISRDYEDANGDGLREGQLVLVTPEGVSVLASGLIPPGDDGGEDAGIWFGGDAVGIQVRVAVQGKTRRKLVVGATAVETIVSRNP